MDFRGDSRGQAVQVGAVLLLAMIVITLSLYQASVVPHENKQIEFRDYQTVSEDISSLRNAVMEAAAADTSVGVTVKTGSQYPARTLFVNPPPATGTVSTTPKANATISNVTIAGDYENVGTYLANEGDSLNVSTRTLRFDPSYHELRVAQLATEYGATYRNYSEPIAVTSQTLIDANRITLVSVAGDLRAEGYSSALTVEPVSAHTRTVSVTGANGDPVTVTIPTDLSVASWNTLLADQLDSAGDPTNDRYVSEVTAGPRPNTVNVSLEGGATYELRIGRVEVHERTNSGNEPTPDPRYLVSEYEKGTILKEDADGRVKLSVEARDRYNNARSNANVTFNITVGQLEDRAGNVLDTDRETVRTNEDGKAIVWYNASTAGVHPVDVYLGDTVDTSLPSEKKLQYKMLSTGQAGGGGAGGGAGEAGVFILLEGIDVTHSTNNMTFNLNSTSTTSLNLTGIQLAHVTEVNQGGGGSSSTYADGPNEITTIVLNGNSKTVHANEELKPVFFSQPMTFQAGTNTLNLIFDADHSDNQNDQVVIRFHLFFEGGLSASFDQIVFF